MVNGSPPAASCKDHSLAPFLLLRNREAGSHTGTKDAARRVGFRPKRSIGLFGVNIIYIILLIFAYYYSLVCDYMRRVGIMVHNGCFFERLNSVNILILVEPNKIN